MAKTKTVSINCRIDPVLKSEAEMVLDSLGLTASGVISLLYKQIILHRGIPFDLKLPEENINIEPLSSDEFKEEMEKGLEDIHEGRSIPAGTIFAQFRNA